MGWPNQTTVNYSQWNITNWSLVVGNIFLTPISLSCSSPRSTLWICPQPIVVYCFTLATILKWVSSTPLGRPVVPLENGSMATVSRVLTSDPRRKSYPVGSIFNISEKESQAFWDSPMTTIDFNVGHWLAASWTAARKAGVVTTNDASAMTTCRIISSNKKKRSGHALVSKPNASPLRAVNSGFTY